MAASKTCALCVYFNYGVGEQKPDSQGECHGNPPLAFPIGAGPTLSGQTGIQFVSQRPAVRAYDRRCRHFEDRHHG